MIYAIVHLAELSVWRQAQTSCFMRVIATCSPDVRRLRSSRTCMVRCKQSKQQICSCTRQIVAYI